MAPVSYFTDTSRLSRPYRLGRPNTLPDPTNPDDQDQQDPIQKLLNQTSQNTPQVPNQPTSTFGAEVTNRLANRSAATTRSLQSAMPAETTSVAQPVKGFSNPYMQQLSQITKIGQLATQRVQAQNAYRSAQSGGGGLGALDLSGVKGARAKLIAAARSQLGVPYVWGGESKGKGFDCSGLVQWAYGRAGIRMPRVAAAQMTRGKIASIASLKPGDLVGWGHPAHHIAIYLGGGRVIEAPHTGARVRIISLGNKGGGAWGIHLGI